MHAESLEQRWIKRSDLRVGASVGHGQQTGLVVLQVEVLVGKLLAVDGLATGALENMPRQMSSRWRQISKHLRCHG